MRMKQNWLLGDREVAEDVVRAVYKVVEQIGALKDTVTDSSA